MRLGTRTGQETLEGETKWHLNKKVHSISKSQFGTFGVLNDTFGVLNGTLKVPNYHHVGFGPTAFEWR